MLAPQENNNRDDSVDITMDEYWHYIQLIPLVIREFMLFEAEVSFNPKNVWDLRHTHSTLWLLAKMKETSQNIHRAAFNGVHPSIDPPRRAW